MDATTLVGSLAALAMTTSFVPQAWKVIRTRDTAALSAGMLPGMGLRLRMALPLGRMILLFPVRPTSLAGPQRPVADRYRPPATDAG